LAQIPNPQSPIPNPQSPLWEKNQLIEIKYKKLNYSSLILNKLLIPQKNILY